MQAFIQRSFGCVLCLCSFFAARPGFAKEGDGTQVHELERWTQQLLNLAQTHTLDPALGSNSLFLVEEHYARGANSIAFEVPDSDLHPEYLAEEINLEFTTQLEKLIDEKPSLRHEMAFNVFTLQAVSRLNIQSPYVHGFVVNMLDVVYAQDASINDFFRSHQVRELRSTALSYLAEVPSLSGELALKVISTVSLLDSPLQKLEILRTEHMQDPRIQFRVIQNLAEAKANNKTELVNRALDLLDAAPSLDSKHIEETQKALKLSSSSPPSAELEPFKNLRAKLLPRKASLLRHCFAMLVGP